MAAGGYPHTPDAFPRQFPAVSVYLSFLSGTYSGRQVINLSAPCPEFSCTMLQIISFFRTDDRAGVSVIDIVNERQCPLR